MAKRPTYAHDPDETVTTDDIVVSRVHGSIPPPEPPVTQQVKEFLAQEEENDEFHEYRRSTPPPPPIRTPFKEVVMRAYGTREGS